MRTTDSIKHASLFNRNVQKLNVKGQKHENSGLSSST